MYSGKRNVADCPNSLEPRKGMDLDGWAILPVKELVERITKSCTGGGK